MSGRGWERITAVAGLAMAALAIGQLATWANPHYNDPLATITDYYVGSRGKVLLSIDLWTFGLLALVVLAAGLREIVRRSSTADDVLPTVAFGGAVAMLCIGSIFNALNAALALDAGQASESEVRLLMAAGNGVDNFQFLPIGIFAAAIALAMFRGQVLSRWLAAVGVVAGTCLILGSTQATTVEDPSMGMLGMIGLLIYLIWVIAVSVRLLLRPAAASARHEATLPSGAPA
jgi:hypothetical protein